MSDLYFGSVFGLRRDSRGWNTNTGKRWIIGERLDLDGIKHWTAEPSGGLLELGYSSCMSRAFGHTRQHWAGNCVMCEILTHNELCDCAGLGSYVKSEHRAPSETAGFEVLDFDGRN
ncbi:hypothetical protein ANO11243_057000 [Dothideomycetidae sp. 11243]|nr:hypothetical protein ANO11243_057000 [fungal sp. No.11243]